MAEIPFRRDQDDQGGGAMDNPVIGRVPAEGCNKCGRKDELRFVCIETWRPLGEQVTGAVCQSCHDESAGRAGKGAR